MANSKNLKSNSERTPKERQELAKKAGQKSGEKRRELKTMRQMLNYLLAQDITNNKGESKTTLEALMVMTIKKALQGDIKAVQFIRDTIGEMPKQTHEVEDKGITIVVADEKHKQMLEDL